MKKKWDEQRIDSGKNTVTGKKCGDSGKQLNKNIYCKKNCWKKERKN